MPAQQGAGAGVRGSGASGPSGGDAVRPAAGGGVGGASEGRLADDQVRDMFDRIAGVYDVMNTAMTAGMHHRWRARAAELAAVGPGSRVLDVATGTGDLALVLAARVSPGGEVVGVDFAEAMLGRARAKAGAGGPDVVRPRFELGDALELGFADGTFDAATVGFGVRNFGDLERGLRELARVVRGGGTVVVLEITTPTGGPLALFYRLWFDGLVPRLGRVAGRFQRVLGRWRPSAPASAIADAYTYLPSSVRRFPPPAELAAEMRRVGLEDVGYRLLAGGIVAIHTGTVPRGERS